MASVTASGTTTTYTLDGLGNRLAETTGAVTTAFDLDLAAANPTILADGTRRYLPGAPGAGYDLAGTWWSSLTDLSGSPILAVSQTGATTAAVHRDPYGNARPGSTLTSAIGYTGEWADPTGLVNLRARAYDPLSARFIGRDTFGGVASAPQTGNRYAYALANPLRFTDPSGHFFAKALSDPTILITLLMLPIPGLGVIAWAARFLFGAFMGITALTGYDPLTGQQVDGLGRLAAGALFLVPFAGRILSGLREAWAFVGEAREMAGLGRLGAAFSDLRAGGSGLLGDARAGMGGLRTAYRESWLASETGAIRLGRAGEAERMTRVGRWMGAEEHEAMVATGMVQPGRTGVINVAHPAGVEAYMRHALPGTRYVEFDVPIRSLVPGGAPGWATIPGPDSIFSRLNVLRGFPRYEYPRATNIQWLASRI